MSITASSSSKVSIRSNQIGPQFVAVGQQHFKQTAVLLPTTHLPGQFPRLQTLVESRLDRYVY